MLLRGYCIFKTTSEAFETHRILSQPSFQKFGLVVEHCPAPKEYSKDCTLALYFESMREDYTLQEVQILSQNLKTKLKAKNCECKLICLGI